MIFGLPVALFALQMVGVIGSLLIIIFSFGLIPVIGALAINGTLYVVLLKLASGTGNLQLATKFPRAISNKRTTPIDYED